MSILGNKAPVRIKINSDNSAFTIEQIGAGNAFVVEDSASTDSTPFVITAAGKTVVGHTASIPGAFSDEAMVQTVVASAGGLGAGFTAYGFSSSTAGPSIYLNKSKSATAGTNTIVAADDILGGISFSGADGTTYHRGASIVAYVDGTPGTNDMPGRLVFNTTADGASSPTERMRIDSSGNVGIGGTAPAGFSIYSAKNITGATSSYGFLQGGTVLSDVTTSFIGVGTALNTQAAAFTLTSMSHFSAAQSVIGASSAITNQYGFIANGNLTGATNNYGFYGNIASGTGRWNFYAAGTADNYFGGKIALFGAVATDSLVYMSGTNMCTTTAVQALNISSAVPPTATANNANIYSLAVTASNGGTPYTINSLALFRAQQGTLHADSTITYQYGMYISSTLTGGTYNYGVSSFIPAGTNRYNIFAGGTAQNYFAGATSIGDYLPFTDTSLYVNLPTTFNATSLWGVYVGPILPSTTTANWYGVVSSGSTVAATFTLNNFYYFSAGGGSKGTGSTITNKIGYYVSNITNSTNTYGFYGDIASGANKYNLYMNGTAANYLAGSTTFGTNLGITGTTKAAGFFYAGTTDPDSTTRLNYDGNLYVTKLYVGGVLVDGLELNRDTKRAVTASTATTNVDLQSPADYASFFKLTMAATTTLTFTNFPTASNGEVFNFNLMIVNDATPSRVLTWGNTIKWAGGIQPTRTTAANAVDVWTFFYENGVLYGSLAMADVK